jgi:hypothetical protein
VSTALIAGAAVTVASLVIALMWGFVDTQRGGLYGISGPGPRLLLRLAAIGAVFTVTLGISAAGS